MKDLAIAIVLFLLLVVASACSSATATPTPAPAAPAALTLTSPAFADNGIIPLKYSCQGQKVSPEIKWSGAPAGTRSYALIVEDPDAPGRTFIHWVAYDIPGSATGIGEAQKSGGKEGRNSAGQNGYTPPCPPSGAHHYIFTLYALDTASLGLPEGAARDLVTAAMQGHVLAQGKLTGLYQKQ